MSVALVRTRIVAHGVSGINKTLMSKINHTRLQLPIYTFRMVLSLTVVRREKFSLMYNLHRSP